MYARYAAPRASVPFYRDETFENGATVDVDDGGSYAEAAGAAGPAGTAGAAGAAPGVAAARRRPARAVPRQGGAGGPAPHGGGAPTRPAGTALPIDVDLRGQSHG